MIRILVGHVRDRLRELKDESIHCVITSPPYFGLRDYGIEPQVWGGDPGCEHEWGGGLRHVCGAGVQGETSQRTGRSNTAAQETARDAGAFCRHCNAWRGSLGLEPTLGLYVDNMVEICREIRRVLRKDGTFWLNIGDSYCSTAPGTIGDPLRQSGIFAGVRDETAKAREKYRPKTPAGLKPKDLMLIPSRLAVRLCDDGWWVRSDIAWCKRAPMPESCTDRPTAAWEHVFLLTKSAKYFYDQEAVKEDAEYPNGPNAPDAIKSPYGQGFTRRAKGNAKTFRGGGAYTGGLSFDNSARVERDSHGNAPNPSGKRNMRNFWLLGPSPYPDAHFATFPPRIPEICIKAGTSAAGVCPKCGAPWARITQTRQDPTQVTNNRGKASSDNGWAGNTDKFPRTRRIDETIG